jgi:tetratricopeptide (TPR) repeat protein/transcriptional regulator with XRE-family HTH domain
VAEQPGAGFAGLLRQLRAGARLTQEELAEAAGLSPRSVSDLERGIHQTARKDTAALLAGALGLAEPVRTLFVAAARGRVPVAEVLTAVRAEAGPAAQGGAMPSGADGAAPGVVPQQLPAGTGFFAGREAELKELDALLDQVGPDDGEDGDGGPAGAVVISAVAGMAGVGKTALAVHWARRVAGRFPGGQLYVNLRGYDPGPAVTPEEAAGWFLAALGVPAAQIPAEGPARFGLYRSVLAGWRVLIVLDNARDAAQVRPLLPGSPGCLAIVTSRSALAGLAAAEGARPLRLGPLDDDQAARLLAARLGPERVAAAPAAVTELIARCGHLPLALAVMAARAAADPTLPLASLATQLAKAADAGDTGEAGRLEVLETGDAATSLRELLSWSYGQLSEPAAAMFALLGVHCGPDITVPAAASLAGVTRVDAGRALAELAAASLAAEHRPGRYVMHDLVRGYAAEQARQAVGEAGIRETVVRSLDHYLHTVMIVSPDVLLPFTVARPAPGVAPEHPADEQVADWARAEHQVLLQATAQAAATGFLTQAWQIFICQGWFLGGQGYWADFRAVGQSVLAAAEAAGDHAAQGWTHAMIGWSGAFTGAKGQDRAHQLQALNLFRRAGDQAGQAWAHSVGAVCSWNDGDLAGAVTQNEQALTLYRQIGHRTAQGWTLADLALLHAHLRNNDLARGYARQAQEVAPGAEDPAILAEARAALGLVHSQLGEHRQAISCYRQALAHARERKTPMARWVLGMVLAGYGDACQRAGDLPAAVEAWQQALRVLDDLGLPDNLRVRPRLEQARSLSPPG